MSKTLPAPLLERLRRDEPLSRHTTFRIGGPADLFLAVENEEELIAAVRWARERDIPYLLLGGGSNVLVSDEGVRGLVIANRCGRSKITQGARGKGQSCILHLASCISLSWLARYAIRQGLAGLEWAVGIPGTVGGAIVGNAGAHGGCIADSLVSVRVLDSDGEVRELVAEELEFGYRHSVFKKQAMRDEEREIGATRDRSAPHSIILSAEFALSAADRQELQERAARYLARRRKTQPREPSAGSVFRNPAGDTAGRLIEAVGLKGARCGGAQISELHANFIVNRGGATAVDVLTLMELAQQRVFKRFGVMLEPEIVFVE